MEPFTLQPEEKLLINDPYAMWMKTELTAVMGNLKLTNKRLVFVKNANPMAGILILFMKSQRAHVLHEYPLASIVNFSNEKQFKSERLVIDNGIERPRKYVVSKIESLMGEMKRIGVQIK